MTAIRATARPASRRPAEPGAHRSPWARSLAALVVCLWLLPGTVAAEEPVAAAEPPVPVVLDADVAAHLFAPIARPLADSGPRMRGDGYNSDYIFGMTRGLADSTMAPWAKPIFFLITVPLDIVFLPFAAIGGFF